MYWTLDGIPSSFWLARPTPPEELDVVVVGAGIVGLSTAYWLARMGRRPVVVDTAGVAGKASGRNAGFLLTGSAEPFPRLAARHGAAKALAFWRRSRENRELLRSEILDPGLVDADFLAEGSWIAALEGVRTGDALQEDLLRESAEILRDEGFDVEWRGREAVREAAGSRRLAGALFQARDGGLDPVRLCRGLAALGLFEVRTGVRVRWIEARGERVHLVTSAGELLAHRVVLAINAYAPSLLPQLAEAVRPVRGQALATEPGDRVLHGVWYVNDGYDYLRQLGDGTVVLGGRRHIAEEQEVGFLESPTGTVQGALEAFLAEHFPHLAERPVRHRWAGTMGFSHDDFPLVGVVRDVPGAVYAVGFSGHGLSLGFVTGRHLARDVAGEEPGELFPGC